MNDDNYMAEALMFLNLAIDSLTKKEIERAIDQASVALSVLYLMLHEQQRE